MNSVTRSLKYWLAPLGLAFFVSACSQKTEVHYAVGEAGELQFQVAYVPINPNQTEGRMRERVSGLVGYLEQQFSTLSVNSELSRLNQWESNEPMVLTRELGEYVRSALDIHQLTEGNLPLFSEPLASLPYVVQVDNYQVYKKSPVYFSLDSLLSGFIVDRVGVLMQQMGIEYYEITINEQRLSRRLTTVTAAEILGKEPMGSEQTLLNTKHYALGSAACADGNELYVVGKTTMQASALAQWLAGMNRAEAIQMAERLNLVLAIEDHESSTMKRYNSHLLQ